MAYTPNNLTIYTVSYAGAFAGFVASARVLVDVNASDYANPATIIGAFAQAIDVAWEAGPNIDPDTLQTLCLQSASKAVFESRNSPLDTTSANPVTYTTLATAIVAALVAAESYVTGQGITPDPWPVGGGGGITAVDGHDPGISVFTSLGIATVTADTLLNLGMSISAGPLSPQGITNTQTAIVEDTGSLNIADGNILEGLASTVIHYTGGDAGDTVTFQIFVGDPTNPIITFSTFVPSGGPVTVTWAGLFNPGDSGPLTIGLSAAGTSSDLTVESNDCRLSLILWSSI